MKQVLEEAAKDLNTDMVKSIVDSVTRIIIFDLLKSIKDKTD